jgi:pterin-4a-carbinolamine dehydratase
MRAWRALRVSSHSNSKLSLQFQRHFNMNTDLLKKLLQPQGRWQSLSESQAPSSISREFRFKYFKHAWAFMNRVAEECQKQKHHPEWSNTYNIVYIRWTTHSTGGLTDKDIDMAQFCDMAAVEMGELDFIPEPQQTITNPTEVDTLQQLADSSAKEGCKSCSKGSS